MCPGAANPIAAAWEATSLLVPLGSHYYYNSGYMGLCSDASALPPLSIRQQAMQVGGCFTWDLHDLDYFEVTGKNGTSL